MLEQPAFGQRLRELRLERGLSQAALGEGGLSPGYLSRLESGARPPTQRAVVALASRLAVPVSAFDEAGPVRSSPLARLLAVAASASQDDPADVEPLVQALPMEPDPDTALRWQALWFLARARRGQGRHEEERELLAELVELGDELGTAELRVRARTELAGCLHALGDYAGARDQADQAYALAVGLSDRMAALQALISAEAESGRLAEARNHSDELCALAEQAGGTELVRALWSAATVRIRQADQTGARPILERALRESDSAEDLTLWLRLRLAAASLYLQITPPSTELARASLEESAAAVDLVGSALHRDQVATIRAHLAFEEGRIAEAIALSEAIDESALRLSFRDRIRFQALRAQLMIADGRVEEGARTLQELAQQAQDALSVDLAADIWRNAARALSDAYDTRRRDNGQGRVPVS